jgi:hypothetical protein
MHKFLAGLVAGVALLIAAPGALAADVNVRVEGTPDTLVPRTTVTTQAGMFSKDGNPAHTCSLSSAGGALERATATDWSGRWASFGDYEVQTIKGERHASDASDPSGTYWSFWVNYRPASAGVCGTPVQMGDDILFFPSCFAPGGCAEPTPLRIASIPQLAQPGQPFAVRVVEIAVTYDANFNALTSEQPASGASVSAGGRTFTAGADGVAQVTVDARGPAGVRASKPGHVRTATENVCVDCGPVFTPPARDTDAPAATVASVRNRAVYSRRRAPRLLRGSVTADPSGLHSVKIKLTRRVGKRCTYFSGRRERFVKMRCGRGSFLRIGDRADWSYLLPKRLGHGSYVLEVKAIDGAFNRGTPARVRFRVK